MKVAILSKALIASLYRKKLEELARMGVEVAAIVPPHWEDSGSRQLLEAGSSEGYRLYVSAPRWNGHFHLHYYPSLPRLLGELAPDLLHIDEEPYNLATYHALRAARRRHTPALFFSWQNLVRYYPPPFRWIEQAVYRGTAGAIAGTDSVAAVLRTKGYTGALTVAPQFGVDPSVFCPTATSVAGFRVGFLNRLIPAKAPLETIAAFASLPADAHLDIVGDGPLRDAVEAEIRARQLTGRVTLHSRVPSAAMPALIRNLHAVVLPSLTTPRWKEQFGRILIEAMASGVPVVGSDSGEIPVVIGDGGLVVPEGDIPALARTFRQLYDDPQLRARLGRLGRQRVIENYSNARVAEETVAAYRKVLG